MPRYGEAPALSSPELSLKSSHGNAGGDEETSNMMRTLDV